MNTEPAPQPLEPADTHPGPPVPGPPGGVLGGLGPAATVHFLRRVVELTDADRDQDHVDLLVWQHGSIPDRTGFLRGENESPEPALVADVQALERAGATFVAIPCNTALVWVDAMRAAVGIEVLDTVDETVAAARVAVPGLARLGVLATDGTLSAGTYARSAERAGVELVVPGPEVQREVMSVIYDGVKAGRPVPRERFDALVAHLVEKGAQVVALGCTELSVLRAELGVEDPRVVDSIDAVARAAVLRAGGRLRA
ncbi:amino acid racemase [Nostocoides sp. Soil756]|uniref:aspartate/glutamate racemase family protein n=1 Tax=Nostocoides sp. Soil756 TaxID=1736399 RepID=UPI0009E8CE08|nr:amino acid racemase [Tetrasphaera sp. Soil756]